VDGKPDGEGADVVAELEDGELAAGVPVAPGAADDRHVLIGRVGDQALERDLAGGQADRADAVGLEVAAVQQRGDRAGAALDADLAAWNTSMSPIPPPGVPTSTTFSSNGRKAMSYRSTVLFAALAEAAVGAADAETAPPPTTAMTPSPTSHVDLRIATSP
jgi:hypothetical protein